MKRQALLKTLRRIAKENDLTILTEEGKRHTHVTINGQLVTVPRHREIAEGTARSIIKLAEEEAAK